MKRTTVLSFAISATLAVNTFAGGDVSFNGFLSHGYLGSSQYNYLADTEDGDFDFVEAGVKATWSPLDRTSLTGQLFTFELGEYGNYDLILDYLFAEYSVNQALGIRAGRIKKPLGLFNDIQDVDVARTSVLLPMGMYDARYRNFSASVDGINLYGSAGPFEYSAYYGEPHLLPEGGLGAAIVTSFSQQFENVAANHISATSSQGAQIWWQAPLDGLRLGANYSTFSDLQLSYSGTFPLETPVIGGAPLNIDSVVNHHAWRLSAEYFLGDWTFIGEYDNSQSDTTLSQTIAGSPAGDGKSIIASETWYLGAARRFMNKFEAGFLYTEAYGNRQDRKGASFPFPHGAYTKDKQFSLRYNATSWWSIKGEFHIIEGTSRLFNQSGQNPDMSASAWNLIALKSTYSF